MQSNKENRIDKVIETTLKNLNEIIDVDSVMGKPIESEDGMLIPVAKITTCFLAGGGEYGKLGLFKKENDLPFTAANGTIISINPCGFLVKSKDSDYKFLSVKSGKYERLIEKGIDVLDKIKGKN